MSSSYREMSFSVSPVPRGVHVYGKWGIAVSNTDAFSVFTDDMLGTSYIISTWTACCNATAFICKSPYNAMQCNTMQCNIIQYKRIQYNAIQCNAMKYNGMECNTIQCNEIQWNGMQYNTIQCNGIQWNAIQYNAI